MKIVIAPDSFKGSLTALEVAERIQIGFQRVFPDAHFTSLPLSDGGEGFVESLLHAAAQVEYRSAQVSDPLGRPIEVKYALIDGHTAVLDLARASGLILLKPEERDPLSASTYGTGQLIRAAISQGATQVFLGLGGSATNDGGSGLLQALGFELLDAAGKGIGYGGGSLAKLSRIRAPQVPEEVLNTQFILATDVTNPLLGDQGATAVFGPQKGASGQVLADLEAGMTNWEKAVTDFTGKALSQVPGTGAAGGTAYGVLSFLNTRIVSGLDFLLDFIEFERIVEGADLVITGEGRMDGQSRFGKVPVGVARRVKLRSGVPVIAINGSIEGENSWVYEEGLDAVFSSVQSVTRLETALENAGENLVIAAERAARALVVLAKDKA